MALYKLVFNFNFLSLSANWIFILKERSRYWHRNHNIDIFAHH